MEQCRRCGFNDPDYGCICPSYDKWYACPLENPEEINALGTCVECLEVTDETAQV